MFIISFKHSRSGGPGVPEWDERRRSRRAFLRVSVPKSQSRAMGGAGKTGAISLEVFLEVEVRIGHSHYIQQALGAKDSVHSQASFCNAEGNENWKKTSRRGVRSHLRYRGQCGNGQMRSCVSGLESPHIPSAFHPVSVLFASSRI